MRKSKPLQLTFVFADSPKGVGPGGGADASASPPELMPPAKVNCDVVTTPLPADGLARLLELVADPGNLETALAKVVRNQGAPGVDGRSVDDVARHASRLLPKLRQALLSETYAPGDVRRVWIPKPDGGQRGLGIPNVVDRWVQQAVLQVLEPIYDPTFHGSAHGFRPGRGAQTAIAEAVAHVRSGRRFVVDIDLERFFDRVPHQRLLDRLAQRVTDRRLLRLIRLMLKAKVVLPDGIRVSTEEGTPQGGPLSPLLSNIVLDELDRELERRGLPFVRYADDCNIYVRSERAGHRVMASIRQFIEGRLRLKVNEAKSAVDESLRRHFLGFRVGVTPGGALLVQLSSRTVTRLEARIRLLTRRNFGRSLTTCMAGLNVYLRGWMAYFRLCTKHVARTLRYLDSHIRRRLRAILVRQKKRSRHLYRHLIQRGVSRRVAWVTAYSRRGPWWKSRTNGMHQAYPNSWFTPQLVSLELLWDTTHHDWRSSILEEHRPEEPDVRSTSPVL